MINDKIVLLTIFLYITLSLRKVENFVDNRCKIEDFTQEEIPTERIMRAIWSGFKLCILLVFTIYKYYKGEYYNTVFRISIFLILGLGICLFSVFMMEKPETPLTVLLTFETISNEYINVIMIYIIIKVSIDNIIPKGNNTINEIVQKLIGALENVRGDESSTGGQTRGKTDNLFKV
jgi:hypothetical protein